MLGPQLGRNCFGALNFAGLRTSIRWIARKQCQRIEVVQTREWNERRIFEFVDAEFSAFSGIRGGAERVGSKMLTGAWQLL